MARVLFLFATSLLATITGPLVAAPLVISTGEQTSAIIVVSAKAGTNEAQAARDLATYIERMTGSSLRIANTEDAIKKALAGKGPTLIVGQLALRESASLANDIKASLKKSPHLRIDGIGLRRIGTRVYLAGNNDLAHYFAVAELLRRWGCRWYLPTEFGECIPE